MDVVVGIVLTVALTLVAVWLIAIAFIWLHRPTRELAVAAIRVLPDVVRLTARVLRDPATPRSCRLALAGLLVWLASPIDLIPEFVPVIGPLDDIVVAAIVLRWVGRRVGRDRLRAHWTGSDDGFAVLMRLVA